MRLYCKWQVVDDRLSVSVKLTSIHWMKCLVVMTLANHTIMLNLTIELAIAAHFRNWNRNV